MASVSRSEAGHPTRAGVNRLVRADGGVVYAEFIMAFAPFFLLFLGVIQLAFIAAGGMVVQTAAVKATRAAAVIIPDDRFFYDGEKELLLNFSGSSDDSSYSSGLESQLSGNGIDKPDGAEPAGGASAAGSGEQGSGNGGARLAALRTAANVVLSVLAPDPALLMTWIPSGLGLGKYFDGLGRDRYSLRKTAIGESPVARFFTGFLAYNAMAAAINFPKHPGSRQLYNAGEGFNGSVDFSKIENYDKQLTVRITYLFPCTVPIVNLIVCKKINPGSSWGTLVGSGLSDAALEACGDSCSDTLDSAKGAVAQGKDLNAQGAEVDDAKGALPDWFDDEPQSDDDKALMEEMRAGVRMPTLLDLMLRAVQGRFHVLRAECTLPLQMAGYLYPTHKDFEEQDKQDEKSAASGPSAGLGTP